MKKPTHFIFDSIIVALVALMLAGCNGSEVKPLEEIGGDLFPYHLPITALVDAGESLIVGTSRGMASFNIQDGSFLELRNLDDLKEGNGDIYDIVIDTERNFILYSVKDGGIRQISKWDDGRATVLEIPDKGTNYSAYKLFPLLGTDYFITGTSNGVYRWHLSDSLRFDKTLVQLGKADPMRFYSIEESDSYGFVCSGDKGVYRAQRDTLIQLWKESVLAQHDGFQLCQDGLLIPEDCGSDECKQVPVVRFKHSPRNFVIDKGNSTGIIYVYAISISKVEVAEIIPQEDIPVKGRIICTIELPERHLTRPRNTSSRQVGLIKNGYLYVAPGGNYLYKLPLAPYGISDEVISICSSSDARGEKIYLLTNRHDLYSMRLSGKENSGRSQRVRYLRTFEFGGEMELLGVSGRWLIVSENGKPIGYRGYRKTVSRPLEPEGDFIRAGKITCNMWDDGILFQGRDDRVRKYSYSPGNSYRAPALVAVDSITFVKRTGDGFSGREQKPDYYPEKLAILNDILIVGTLHNGVVYKSITGTEEPFLALLDSADSSKILDIRMFRDAKKPSETSLFILDEEHIHRFLVKEGIFERAGSFRLDTLNTISHHTRSNYFNHIYPIASDQFYLFSDYYDFQKGFDSFSIRWDSTLNIKAIRQEASTSFNDALQIGGKSYLIGTCGIMRDDRRADRIAVSTTPYERFIAKFWPWNLILTIVGLLASLYLVFRKSLADTIRLSRIRKRLLRASSSEVYNDVLKLAEETRMRTIKGHLALSDLIMHIKSTVSELKEKENRAENQAKIEMAKDRRQKLSEDYRSGYVTALFDALVSASRMSELDSNIERFLKEKSAGKNGQDRLAILDNLGHVINDVRTIVRSTVDYREKDQKLVDKAYETFDGIVKKYHLEYDGWNSVMKNHNKNPFIAYDDVTNKSKRAWDNYEEVCQVFNGLYIDKLYKLLSAEYDRFGQEFFASFTKNDPTYRKVFNSLDYYRLVPDPKDKKKKKDEAHLTKRSFLIFPHCAEDYVGIYLFGDTFPKIKTGWKKERVEGERDKVHHLPNLANEEEYGGILWVMAKAGLMAIESENKKNENRKSKNNKQKR